MRLIPGLRSTRIADRPDGCVPWSQTAPLAGALCHAVFRIPSEFTGGVRTVNSRTWKSGAEQCPRASVRFSRTTAVVPVFTAFGCGCTPAPAGPSSRHVVARAGRSCRPDPAVRAVLPANARLTDRDEFTTVVRRGRRSGRTLVVMHVLPQDALPMATADADGTGAPGSAGDAAAVGGPRVGFIVSKAVGGSVVRHRVARRLRHLMRDRLVDAPAGSRIVVRALPASAQADSTSLGADLDRALRGVLSAKGSGRRGSARPSSATSDLPTASSRS